MAKFLVSRVLGFVMIETLDSSDLYTQKNSSEGEIFDSLKEAEKEYDSLMEAQHCWLLISDPKYHTYRIAEYIDGPKEDYLDDGEVIIYSYKDKKRAEYDLKDCMKPVYVVVGNEITGQIRQIKYTEGPLDAYIYENELIIFISDEVIPEVSEQEEHCYEWRKVWESDYVSNFVKK